MRPQTEADRKNLILEKIQENLFTFLEFMETKLDTSNDFLKLIVELQGRLDKQTFSKLFIRVCANYQCNSLEINSDMAIQALHFLVSQKQDRDAALGLLRLMYINNISLVEAGVDLLLQFQDTYELQVMSVFKSLQGPKMQVRESLPPTLFCFTPPILSSLKAGGSDLHTQVPIQWLPYFVSIICYSFISEQKQFDDFVELFKAGVGELYDQLKSCNFTNLLQELCELTRQMQPKFFKSLALQTIVLHNGFDMVRKRAICKFDEQIVRVLISNDSDSMNVITQRPAVSTQKGLSQLKKLTSEFVKLNQHINADLLELEKPLPEEVNNIFTCQGISNLLPIQHICMSWLVQTDFLGKYFIQMETGQGKTAICLSMAALNSIQNGISIIVNTSKDLLFRDFKNATNCALSLKAKVILVDDSERQFSNAPQIIYSSPELLPKLMKDLKKATSLRTVLIIDEFDTLMFDKVLWNPAIKNSIMSSLSVFGFTGSNLQGHHKDYIHCQLEGQCIDFAINLFNREPPTQLEAKVFQLVKEYCNEIVRLCQVKSLEVPVVCILDDYHDKIASSLKKSCVPILNLHGADAANVDSSLRIFNERQESIYPVAIINESQGRGLDFKSSKEIEDAGGVLVIIGTLPQSFLQYRQFIGRTGRAGNKGQYSVILLDKDSKGFVGSIYLTRRLEELKNTDLIIFQQLPLRHTLDSARRTEKAKGNAPELVREILPHIDEEEKGEPVFDDAGHKDFSVDQTLSEPSLASIVIARDSVLQEGTRAAINQAEGIIETTQFLKIDRGNLKSSRLRRKCSSPRSLSNEIDKGYFEAYGRLEIHNEMLNDRIRVKKYKEAIDAMCKDKIVIDVGAGTAVLSCLAAKAGASKVYALENAEIVHHAHKVIRDNKVSSIVKVFQGDASKFTLEDVKADVIVSEWMGYMLIFERMLPSVLQVRQNCLKVGGIMIPSKAQIFLAAISQPPQSEEVDLRSIKRASYKKAEQMDCKPAWVCSESAEIFALNLELDTFDSNSFSCVFNVTTLLDCKVSGFVIWFDTELCPGVTLSTSPFEETTHWHQTILSLREDRVCREKEQISGKISVGPQPRNHRALKIDLETTFAGDDKAFTAVYTLEAQ